VQDLSAAANNNINDGRALNNGIFQQDGVFSPIFLSIAF
jgi:hypothetical protein